MRTVSRLAAPVLSVAALCASANAFAIDAYDAASGQLSITTVSVNGVAYQSVTVLVTSYTLLGVDGGTPGADTFDPALSLLSMGSVQYQGNVYNNVRVRINGFTLLTGSPAGSTPTSGNTGTTGTSGTSGTPSTPTTPTITPGAGVVAADSCNLPNFQSDLLSQINAYRASTQICKDPTPTGGPPGRSGTFLGTGSLSWNSQLFDSAAAHSLDMATNNFMDHPGTDGSTPFTRMTAAGYSFSWAGENVAQGSASAADVMALWMSDYGHCANIMESHFADVGVACVLSKNSVPYWTMDLGHH